MARWIKYDSRLEQGKSESMRFLDLAEQQLKSNAKSYIQQKLGTAHRSDVTIPDALCDGTLWHQPVLAKSFEKYRRINKGMLLQSALHWDDDFCPDETSTSSTIKWFRNVCICAKTIQTQARRLFCSQKLQKLQCIDLNQACIHS